MLLHPADESYAKSVMQQKTVVCRRVQFPQVGDPGEDPKYYVPYYRDPPEIPLIIGNPPHTRNCFPHSKCYSHGG